MTEQHVPAFRSDSTADADRGQYLSESCALLWPPPAEVTLGHVASGRLKARGSDHGRDTEFILLPGIRRPRLLVPATPAASTAAIRGYGEPGSRAARLGVRALSVALANRTGSRAFRSRVWVHTPPGCDTIESFLRTVLGREVFVSMHLGPPRANRKPVLQLLTAQGEPAGFAKIGTRPLTKDLVQVERNALIRLGSARLRGMEVPSVLHYGEWRDMNVLVLSALPLWLRRRPVQAMELAAAMNSVASVGGLHRESLAAGSYWNRLTSRLAAADTSDSRDALRRALDNLAAHAGDAELLMGSWHGDWTPWNMANTRNGLLVWDWERFTDGVPLGFDALHYRLQRDVVPGRRNPRAAAADCIKGAPQTLAGFGINAGSARLTAVLYLADLATRYLADRQVQAGALLGAAGSWLIPAISDEVSRQCLSLLFQVQSLTSKPLNPLGWVPQDRHPEFSAISEKGRPTCLTRKRCHLRSSKPRSQCR